MTDQVYIELFHGRSSPDEPMEDWGTEGPVLGPFRYVHVTYANVVHVRIGDEDFDLEMVGDCLAYGDTLYGDWSVIGETLAMNDELRHRREPIDQTLATLRATRVRTHAVPPVRLTATIADLRAHLRVLDTLTPDWTVTEEDVHVLSGLAHFVSEALAALQERTVIIVERVEDRHDDTTASLL